MICSLYALESLNCFCTCVSVFITVAWWHFLQCCITKKITTIWYWEVALSETIWYNLKIKNDRPLPIFLLIWFISHLITLFILHCLYFILLWGCICINLENIYMNLSTSKISPSFIVASLWATQNRYKGSTCHSVLLSLQSKRKWETNFFFLNTILYVGAVIGWLLVQFPCIVVVGGCFCIFICLASFVT